MTAHPAHLFSPRPPAFINVYYVHQCLSAAPLLPSRPGQPGRGLPTCGTCHAMTSPSHGNPFSTRHVRPGAVEFLFPPGEHVDQLVERLRETVWWGQLTGPHGAGKTTLLHTLYRRLRECGREIEWYTLHKGHRKLPTELRAHRSGGGARRLVIVDGYEQLGRWARRQLKRRCRRRSTGLLVTTHVDAGLPTIYRLQPTLPVALRLVSQLLSDDPETLERDEIIDCFQTWHGNVREMLFELYDRYEIRRRSSGRSNPGKHEER